MYIQAYARNYYTQNIKVDQNILVDANLLNEIKDALQILKLDLSPIQIIQIIYFMQMQNPNFIKQIPQITAKFISEFELANTKGSQYTICAQKILEDQEQQFKLQKNSKQKQTPSKETIEGYFITSYKSNNQEALKQLHTLPSNQILAFITANNIQQYNYEQPTFLKQFSKYMINNIKATQVNNWTNIFLIKSEKDTQQYITYFINKIEKCDPNKKHTEEAEMLFFKRQILQTICANIAITVDETNHHIIE